METRKNGIIMERYCSKVDANVVIMKNMVKNDGSYQCISHTNCGDKESCSTLCKKEKEDNKKLQA